MPMTEGPLFQPTLSREGQRHVLLRRDGGWSCFNPRRPARGSDIAKAVLDA